MESNKFFFSWLMYQGVLIAATDVTGFSLENLQSASRDAGGENPTKGDRKGRAVKFQPQ